MNNEYNLLRSQIVSLENELNWKSQIATSNTKMKLKKINFTYRNMRYLLLCSRVKWLAKGVRYE